MLHLPSQLQGWAAKMLENMKNEDNSEKKKTNKKQILNDWTYHWTKLVKFILVF